MNQQGGFGRYREIALLGQGGMARVVLAALPGPAGTQKLLVVKEMLPELAQDPEFVGMFTDEARLACRLDHPNLIQTYELAEVNGRFFFVMEYLEGQSLSVVLGRTRRQVPLPIYLRVLTRVLAGLQYAHDLCDLDGRPLGVVHRDVTPQNIFLCYGGAIKLVDFGIAKAAGAAILTKAGTFKGKIAYASKEQIANEPVDRRADIFAAGCLLWEGIVGQRITKDLAEPAILQRRFLGSEPSALEVNPNAPPELSAIARKAMAPEREDRYATAAEMQAALEAYIERSGTRVVDEDVGNYVAQLFAEQRSQVRKLVQERLSRPASEPSSTPLFVQAAASSQSAATGSSPGSDSGARSGPGAGSGAGSRPGASAASGDLPTEVTASLEQASPRAVAPARRRSIVLLAVAALLVLGAIGGGSILRRRRARAETESAAAAAAAAQAAAASSASLVAGSAGVSPGAGVAETRLVDVSLVASPAAARFTLDGRPLEGNPYKGRLVSDGVPHRLEATAPGFATETRTVTLDGAVQVELSLKPEPRGAGGKAPRPGDDGPAVRPGGARTAKPIDTGDPYGPGGGR